MARARLKVLECMIRKLLKGVGGHDVHVDAIRDFIIKWRDFWAVIVDARRYWRNY